MLADGRSGNFDALLSLSIERRSLAGRNDYQHSQFRKNRQDVPRRKRIAAVWLRQPQYPYIKEEE